MKVSPRGPDAKTVKISLQSSFFSPFPIILIIITVVLVVVMCAISILVEAKTVATT